MRIYKDILTHNNGYYVFSEKYRTITWFYLESDGFGNVGPEVYTAWWGPGSWDSLNGLVRGLKQTSWFHLLVAYGVGKQEAYDRIERLAKDNKWVVDPNFKSNSE